MREFILKASTATTADFSLNDLPGAGRMDVVCRSINSAFWVSDGLRKDTKMYIVLEGKPNLPLTVEIDSKKIKRFSPDERNIASHIKIAINKFNELKGAVESEPGVTIMNKRFEELIREKNKDVEMIYLDQNGSDIRKFKFKKDICCILGDHLGLDENTKKFLDGFKIKKISVGPYTYLSSTVIAVIYNELDRRGV